MSIKKEMTSADRSSYEHSNEPVIIIGGGLAGLTAAYELTKAKQKVIIIDQENEASLGGQAFWSLGGIFLVDTSQQRWMGVKDTIELARKDWFNSAQFDRLDDQDFWAVQWANAYLDFAHHSMKDYLTNLGMGFLPTVGWAERGDGTAGGHGNSVPRFHITWGTGPEVVRIFREPVLKAAERGLVEFKFRHAVDKILVDEAGRAIGIQGTVLKPSNEARGVATSRESIDTFSIHGKAVIIASGGIGANIELIKEMWPAERLGGRVPDHVVTGVPAYVDGRMIQIAEGAGARVVNKDRMWHYTEGLKNWNPIWPNHGIRVLPGPTSIWLDAKGERLPSPCFPGCDTLSTLRRILSTGYDYSWFILNKTIIEKEFSLSGSEQNPDLTGKSIYLFIKRLLGGQEPVRKFREHGEDFVVEENLEDLVTGMNKLRRGGAPELQYEHIKKIMEDRDGQVANPFTKDSQIMLIHNALKFRGDRLARCAKLHRILDPAYGPLIAVRMNILTRKTLGGIQTNLESQALRSDGSVFPGLYAVGEAAGFGGGGIHGYNALEGTFLTGCVFSGRAAGLSLSENARVLAKF
jgi:predicted oxidoreductase